MQVCNYIKCALGQEIYLPIGDYQKFTLVKHTNFKRVLIFLKFNVKEEGSRILLSENCMSPGTILCYF